MDYTLKVNPTDLQDREGFLAFLQGQARAGWEAVRVWPFATVFRRTDTPPKGYTMAYDPMNQWPAVSPEGKERVLGHSKSGIGIYPADQPASPDPDWADTFQDNTGMVPDPSFDRFGLGFLHLFPTAVLIAALVPEPALRQWLFSGSTLVVLLLGVCLLSLAILALVIVTSCRHAAQLKAARGLRRVYTPTGGLARLSAWKNRLSLLQPLLTVVALILVLVGPHVTVP